MIFGEARISVWAFLICSRFPQECGCSKAYRQLLSAPLLITLVHFRALPNGCRVVSGLCQVSSLRDLVRVILPLEWSEIEGGQVIAPPEPVEVRNSSGRPDLDDFIGKLASAIEADGIAVAFKEGDRFVCRASQGRAPSVDTVIKPGEGLCGIGIQQGRTVIRQEMEGELQSLVSVPVYVSTRLTGCIAAFSSRPDAFREIDIEMLVAVAGHIGELERPLSTFEKLEALRDVAAEPAQNFDGDDYLAKIHGELYPRGSS